MVGEQSLNYSYEPSEVSGHLADDVSGWLRRVALDRGSSSMAIGA